MKKRLGITIPIAVAALAVIAWNLYFGADAGNGQIHLSGNMDVTQVDLAFKIAGRLQQRLVDEGHRSPAVSVSPFWTTRISNFSSKKRMPTWRMPDPCWLNCKPAAGPKKLNGQRPGSPGAICLERAYRREPRPGNRRSQGRLEAGHGRRTDRRQ